MKTMQMHMLVIKNTANSTMYTMKELILFINIQWNCI